MVAVDSDVSTERAFHEALKSFHPETDKIYLCSMYVNLFKYPTRIFIILTDNFSNITTLITTKVYSKTFDAFGKITQYL